MLYDIRCREIEAIEELVLFKRLHGPDALDYFDWHDVLCVCVCVCSAGPHTESPVLAFSLASDWR